MAKGQWPGKKSGQKGQRDLKRNAVIWEPRATGDEAGEREDKRVSSRKMMGY